MFCCTTDVVTRALPLSGGVRYPGARKRLLELMKEDQRERSSRAFLATNHKTAVQIRAREDARAEEAFHLLREIKTPSAANVGLDGSRALWIIALHNCRHKSIGPIVLKKMQRLFYTNKNSVFYPGIPYLTDRAMLDSKLFDHSAKQRYGTQRWCTVFEDGTSKSGLFPVIDEAGLSQRRAKFGLATKGFGTCEHAQ